VADLVAIPASSRRSAAHFDAVRIASADVRESTAAARRRVGAIAALECAATAVAHFSAESSPCEIALERHAPGWNADAVGARAPRGAVTTIEFSATPVA